MDNFVQMRKENGFNPQFNNPIYERNTMGIKLKGCVMDLILLKSHLDPDDKLSEEEWEGFVESSSDLLFDSCLDRGKDLLEVFLSSKNNN